MGSPYPPGYPGNPGTGKGGPGIPGSPKPPEPTPTAVNSVSVEMIPSATAESLIEHFEGLRLDVYYDPAGFATVGYGHKLTHLEHYPNGITKQQAYDLMQSDLDFAAKCVRSVVKVSLNQGQFDALCDFAFNLGGKALADSTLVKLLNMGEYEAAGRELPRWVYASGEVLSGLVKRRNAELEVWQTGTFTKE